ncbi:hypothetical protein Tco_0005889 [Tanacetum coccineum]
MTVPIKNMFNVVDICSLVLTVGHPNGFETAKIVGTSSETGGLYMFACTDIDKTGFKTGDHSFACDICHKPKQTREPFPLSDHKSTGLSQRTYCLLPVFGALAFSFRFSMQYSLLCLAGSRVSLVRF